MATSNIEYEFSFSDGTVTKIAVGPFAITASAITNIKTNIDTFNNTNKSDWISFFANDDLSALLAKPITGATIITQDVTTYNLSENLLEEAANNG